MNIETQITLDKFRLREYQWKFAVNFEEEKYKKFLLVFPRRCLSGDSHIIMADGSFKLLKDIKCGDLILSWNGEEFVSDRVVNKWETEEKEAVEVSVTGRNSLITSKDHFFFCRRHDAICAWVKAHEIKYEDEVALYSGHRKSIGFFHACVKNAAKIKMYDIETEKNHNFVANGYVVHNSGKDFIAFNLILRRALKRVGSYFYCLPTFKQARLVIWDSITIDGKRFLECIPKELIKRMNSQEMVIELVNGSIIRLIGSDTYDTSLVGTNPVGVIFSEFALADDRAYKYVRPILNANGGFVVLLSCVAPNTLVITNDGIRKISSLHHGREEYNEFGEDIWGLGGYHKAEEFYYGGKQKTLTITLSSGYQIECTANHCLWDGSQWKRADSYKVGDLIPIQYGQQCFGQGFDISNDFIYKGRSKHNFVIDNPDFFYLLGLIHADGNYNRNAVCITKKKDPEIIKFLQKYGFRTRSDGIHHVYSNREFCALLEFIGFKHGARNKEFPEKLLDCNKEELIAFLQGVFDGDGTSNSCPSKRGTVKLTSTCKSFMQTLQVLLLNFGIVSSIRSEYKRPTERVKVSSLIYNLEISDYFAYIFYRDIGFRLERKQQNKKYITNKCKEGSGNVYPVDQFYYSPIKEIVDSENEVFDFVIPETHSFFSNGFISHNTPRGHNFFYDLYQIAKNAPQEWYCEKLTVDDTHHIPIEAIKRDIYNGEISEELAKQEYWCFPGDQSVLTSQSVKNIKDVKVGELVVSHTGRHRKVLNVMSRHYTGELIELHSYGSYDPIKCTPDHPIRIYDSVSQTYSWKKAVEITTNDLLVFPKIIDKKIDFTLIQRHENDFFHELTKKDGCFYERAENCVVAKIIEINKIPYDGTVYNLEVQYDNSYLINGRAVHNCDFNMGIEGSYYGRYMDKMRLENRITEVPWEPTYPVHVAFDLGMRDSTALVFFQVIGTVIHIIDCYENHSEGLEHYAKYLHSKEYRYGKLIAPHDIEVRELGTGMSRLEKARQMGLHFIVAPKLSVMDGIEAVRSTLPRVWIDQSKCAKLIKALENYRKEFDNVRKVYYDRPTHDQWSHLSDGTRYAFISLSKLSDGTTPEEIDRRYREVMYGTDDNLPSIFR